MSTAVRALVSFVLLACVAVHGLLAVSAQSLIPTEDQIRIADIEVGRLVTLLRLEPGMKVADVGAGLGAWTLRFARFVGPSGHVYATDIGDEQLTALRDGALREARSNITVIKGATASTNLPDACCDAILVRNVFHYFTEPAAMIRSLAAALKPGGRLAVADFPPRPNSPLPPGVPANRGGNGVPSAVVESEVGEVLRHVVTLPDWSPDSVPPGLPAGILPPFVVIFEKPDSSRQ